MARLSAVFVIAIAGLAAFSGACLVAQQTGQDATSALIQAAHSFSNGIVVNSVHLTGTATIYRGTTEESGQLVIDAHNNGQSDLSIETSNGTYKESQGAIGNDMVCTWTGENGQVHLLYSQSCTKPFIWFLPELSMQVGKIPPTIGVAALTTASDGPCACQHLMAQVIESDLPTQVMNQYISGTKADLWLDQKSFLPSIVTFFRSPDDGSNRQVHIRVEYGDYQTVNGVNLPFDIRRYVNGALQLQLSIASASIQ